VIPAGQPCSAPALAEKTGVDVGQLDAWIDEAFAELAAWLGI